MHKTITFLLFAFITSFTQAQVLTSVEKLASAAQIWGFLKYYHPEVGKGTYNWDQQLLDILPNVERASDRESLSTVYMDWLDTLGPVEECRKCTKESGKDYFNKNFNLGWIETNRSFSEELSKRLRYIEQNRFQGKHFYARPKSKQVGNLELHNEVAQVDFDWSNQNHRLLIAFKYWNFIEYFFPYKYQTDIPWSEVLKQVIPEFKKASKESEFQKAFAHLLVQINDGHGYYNFTKKPRWIPNHIEYIEGQFVVNRNWTDSIAQFSDLKKGDILLRLDGVSMKELESKRMVLQYGSNDMAKKMRIALYFGLADGQESLTYTVQRDSDTLEIRVPTFQVKEFNRAKKAPVKWRIDKDSIGYVNMGQITVKEALKAMEELKNTKGIIFDVRNYPKGTLYAITRSLIPEQREFFKVVRPDYNYPGKFYWDTGRPVGLKKPKHVYTGKVIILANEWTQSHAEFTVMALQTADDALTIGSQTAGADGNICRVDLGDGLVTAFSGIGIFYPDGTETQRKGVKIDMIVRPTISGIREGKDEVLQTAIALIQELEE